jgi:hypothetical protein
MPEAIQAVRAIEPAQLQSEELSRMAFLRRSLDASVADFTLPALSSLLSIDKDTPAYVPFAFAVYWIASKQGQNEITSADRVIWETSRSDLLRRIISGEVGLIGCRNGNYETIPADDGALAEVVESSLVDDSIFGSGKEIAQGRPSLLCCYCIDQEHWKGGLSDRLICETKELTHLQVSISDVFAIPEIRAASAAAANAEGAATAARVQNVGTKPPNGKKRGPQFATDWDSIRKKVFARFKRDGLPDRFNPNWQRQNDIAVLIHKLTDDAFADSTVRQWASRFIDEWKASL